MIAPAGIEGFADLTSATVGQTVGLYVSTVAPSFRDRVPHGLVRRRGRTQGVVLVGDRGRGATEVPGRTDPKTLTVSCANWARSIGVKLTKDWVPGEYLIKLVPSKGSASYVPLAVATT